MDDYKNMQVLTIVKKDILHKLIIDNKTDLISYPYYSHLDIKKLYSMSRKVLKKTTIINLYDNKINKAQEWGGTSPTL